MLQSTTKQGELEGTVIVSALWFTTAQDKDVLHVVDWIQSQREDPVISSCKPPKVKRRHIWSKPQYIITIWLSTLSVPIRIKKIQLSNKITKCISDSYLTIFKNIAHLFILIWN